MNLRIRRPHRLWLIVAAAVGVWALVVAWKRGAISRVSTDELLRDARRALQKSDFPRAESLARDVLKRQPDSSSAMIIAAKAGVGLKRFDDALEFLQRVPDTSEEFVSANESATELLVYGLHRHSDADELFQKLVRDSPAEVNFLRLYARFLRHTARRSEATPLLFQLIRLERQTQEELIYFGSLDIGADPVPPNLDQLATAPDPLVRLLEARGLFRKREFSLAARRLADLIRVRPNLADAQILLGWSLWQAQDRDGFEQWLAAVPPECEAHPEFWWLWGQWCDSKSDTLHAARCYWEAIRQEPTHKRASYRLSQNLAALGRSEAAAVFAEQAENLQKLADAFTMLLKFGGNPGADTIRRQRTAARLTESLGRIWEARAWCQEALKIDPQLRWAHADYERLNRLLQGAPPMRLDRSEVPALLVDLSDLSVPDRPQLKTRGQTTMPDISDNSNKATDEIRVRFVEEARQRGIDFQYFNGGDHRKGIPRLYEMLGGGVAVLDFDGDARPDVYLTQGTDWPPREESLHYRDKLFWNRNGQNFEDVTSLARLGDQRFSQGAAVADFDNDGFADLFVVNLGEHRLYRNNGDGTFEEVPLPDPGRKSWTTSCLFADLNGDGFPDLYLVNYLAGENLFDTKCKQNQEDPGIWCLPQMFSADPDLVFLNLGDGRFQDVTTTAGVHDVQGKGLGIAAADFEQTGKLNIFIANDETPNFYFQNQTQPPGRELRLVENGLLSGLAFNRLGNAEACMGVAVGDADGNGQLDLFVTNFLGESNTLYLQQSAGLFTDATPMSGLLEPSLKMLGFGAQFLDADLDGWQDLIVTNGHIQMTRGLPYRMRPQFFHNRGEARFDEVPPETAGEFFRREYLGRGLAKLDWNCDGLEDVVISHLDVPAALLTNRTHSPGHFLAVRLCGVLASRDAIGTTVTVRSGEQTWMQQLTAGDGFLASNQRQLVFGLGQHTQVDELTVRWPSGQTQTFPNQSLDVIVILVEMQNAARVLDLSRQ